MDDSKIQYEPVTSSNVVAIGYDPVTFTLFVKFANRRGYYKNVPKDVFEQFRNAPSKGKFLFQVIRNWGQDNRYEYHEL